ECGTHTGKKELSERVHVCDECGYKTSRDHASGRVILQRGLNNVLKDTASHIVPMDCRERKLPSNEVGLRSGFPTVARLVGVLSGVLYLDKCRSRNASLRELEASTLSRQR
ncbi:MAG: hypothetical protein QNJ55_33035, partial [Xenococcus sp. MO_188.B8]|nr:hypothetical protein [Xenococcus sp. MO_188.B8]